MKVKAIVSVSMALLALAQSASAICYKYDNPLKPTEKQEVTCDMVTVTRNTDQRFAPDDNMFDVQFSCDSDDKETCRKAEDTFKEAGRLITQQLVLKEPIVVKAQFKDICTDIPDCEGVLGAAGPSQTIELLDEDGVTRMYAQALVKQFQFDQAPQFGPNDIDAVFNSKFDFHFFEDGDTIPADKEDFLTVVLHEYIHGLGFTSGWNEYINPNEPANLTPLPQVQNVDGGIELSFIEMAFDRYMVSNPGSNSEPMPKLAAQIKEFTNTPASIAPDEQTLISNFKSSAQGEVSARAFQLAITDGDLGFVPTSGEKEALILETSLNPFRQGSSISHLDSTRFTGKPDFLMRFAAEPGRTLQDSMKINGATLPIGPGIVSLLNTLGYATADNPNPYKPSIPGQADSGSGNAGNGTDSGDGTDAGNSTDSGDGTDTGSDGTDSGSDGTDGTGEGNGQGNGNDEPNNNGNDNGNGNSDGTSGNGNNNGNGNGDGSDGSDTGSDGSGMPGDGSDGSDTGSDGSGMPGDGSDGSSDGSDGSGLPGDGSDGGSSDGSDSGSGSDMPGDGSDGSDSGSGDPFGVSDEFEGRYSARFRL